MDNLIVSRQERTLQVLKEPGTLDNILEYVIEGGTFIEWARDNKLSYAPVARWLYSDKSRAAQIDTAIQLRGEWIIQRVIGELKTLGLTDIRTLYDANGKLLPIKEWPEEMARAVTQVETGENGNKIRLADKTRALELLGKTLSMFVDRQVIVGRMQLEDLVAESRKKVGSEKVLEIEGATPGLVGDSDSPTSDESP